MCLNSIWNEFTWNKNGYHNFNIIPTLSLIDDESEFLIFYQEVMSHM